MHYKNKDYKELIARLKTQDLAIKNRKIPSIFQNAADAIETLLAERDAAVNELKDRVGCSSCAYFYDSILKDPCVSCRKESNWKWRRPQKHD